MNAKEIMAKHFEKAAFNGYKTDDVDDFLKEVSDEFAKLQKEKDELESKLQVLADKIREYRDDEDALKDALLIAQKQGNAIVAESKASAEKLTKETNDAVAKQLAESKAKSERLVKDADEYSKKTRQDADEKAAKIVGDAKNKAEEIKTLMERQQEIQENILQQTRKEVLEYRSKVLAAYKAHVDMIEKLPDQVENAFVKKTAEAVEKREADRKKQAAQQAKVNAAKAAAQQKAKEAQKPAPKPAPAAEPEKPAEPFEPVSDDTKVVSEKTTENNLPFFNSSGETIARHDNLKFGKNNENK